MTSNVGSDKRENGLGFGKTSGDMAAEKAIKGLEELLRPEFLGRVDEIVVFKPLDFDSMCKIANLMLREIVEPLKERSIELKYDDEVLKIIAKAAVDKPRGARELRNYIRRNVEDKITNALVENFDKQLDCFTVKADGDKLVVEY